MSTEVLPNLICLTVDVEWAQPEVLADIVRLLDERGLRATFFCTHPGVSVPGHERALHPNFRRNGDAMQKLREEVGAPLKEWGDTSIYRHVIETTKAFCPEAAGVRAHSLFYSADVLANYRQAGLEYDSSYFLPMMSGLSPVWHLYDILELPIYYVDLFDVIERATDFRLERLHLDRPGMKVFDFHPNPVFINASTNAQYLDSKPYYHDYDQLLRLRDPGEGVRTLFLELLDFIVARRLPTATLANINAAWRRRRDGHTPKGNSEHRE